MYLFLMMKESTYRYIYIYIPNLFLLYDIFSEIALAAKFDIKRGNIY